MSDAEKNRTIVLLSLVQGPRSGAALRELLAARLGTKDTVTRTVQRLSDRGLLRGEKRHHRLVVWHLTQAGITEAMRLVVARQEARAAP